MQALHFNVSHPFAQDWSYIDIMLLNKTKQRFGVASCTKYSIVKASVECNECDFVLYTLLRQMARYEDDAKV